MAFSDLASLIKQNKIGKLTHNKGNKKKGGKELAARIPAKQLINPLRQPFNSLIMATMPLKLSAELGNIALNLIVYHQLAAGW